MARDAAVTTALQILAAAAVLEGLSDGERAKLASILALLPESAAGAA
jgi:hypothetical protein